MTERFALGISNCRSVKSVIDGVRKADELGAEIAFISEDVNCRDGFELCALSASATERIKISTGVVNPYTRNPTSLAMGIATLDEISGGRAVLGLGTSSPSLIEEQMGIPMGKRVGILRETTAIVRGLLAGEHVTYLGQHFVYRDAHLEVSPPRERVPVFFAAMGPQTLHLAGEVADGVLLNVGASTDYIRWAVEHVREGCARAGRSVEDVTIAAWLTVYVTESRDEGLRKARTWLATMLSVPNQGELLLRHGGFDASILPEIRRHVRAYPHAGDPAAAAEAIPPEYAERMTLIGNRDRIAERVAEYREAGVQVPVMGLAALRALLG